MTVAAVVLAAGGGRRFCGPTHKLLAPFRGRPLVSWAIAAALAAELDETIVVTGALDLGDLVPAGARVVDNRAWASGQASSLRAGVAAAGAAGHDAVVVGLGDQPLVPAGAWRAVAGAGGDVVVATFAGRRRPPVRLARRVWSLLPTEGDEGARALVRHQPALVREIACDGEPGDVDTVEDLARWS